MTERSASLLVPGNHPLIGVIVREGGREMVCYVADEEQLYELPGQAGIERALSLAGAWSDLDWEEAEVELDRIRHPPSTASTSGPRTDG